MVYVGGWGGGGGAPTIYRILLYDYIGVQI